MVHMSPTDFIEQALAADQTERDRLIGTLNGNGPEVVRELAAHVDHYTRTNAGHATRLAELLVDVTGAVDAPVFRGLARRATAHTLRVRGRYAESVPVYEQAVALFEMAGEPVDAARTQLGQISSLMYLGENEAALALAERARQIFRAHRERRNLATLNLNSGVIYYRLDRNREALRYLDRARRGYLALSDKVGVATVEVNRGNSLTQLGQFRAARQAFERALPVLVERQMDAWVAMTESNIAFLDFAQGHYNAALDRLLTVRDTFMRLAVEKDVAITDLDLSEIYLVLNQLDEAANLCDEAAVAFDANGMRYEAARARVNRALANLRAGRPDEALPLLEEAENLYRSDKNVVGEGAVALHRAQTLHLAGQPEAAVEVAQQALVALTDAHAPMLQAYAANIVGHMAIGLGHSDRAREAFETALELGQRLRQPSLLYQTYYGLGRLLAATDRNRARQYYLAAISQLERVRAQIQAEDLRLAFLEDKVQVYEDLVLLALEDNGPTSTREAFSLVERARSRALLDLLIGALDIRLKTTDPNSRPVVERLQMMREELNGYYRLLARREGDATERAAVVRAELAVEIQSREEQVSRLVRQLQVRRADVMTLHDAPVVTAEDVQALMGTNETMIAYYAVRNEIVAFIVNRDQLTLTGGLATVDEVTAMTARLRSQMAQFGYGRAHVERHQIQLNRTTARQLEVLYDTLVRPLEPALSGERLTIVPHGILHYLPFHAFHDGNAALIERYEVAYAPSASVLKLCRERPKSTSQRALALGVSAGDLPFVSAELQSFAEMVPSAQVYEEETATLETLRREAPSSKIVHLASHAFFRPESPLFSLLRLADGWMTVHDIYNLDLDADLVTLSACDTGVSYVAPGDELLGMMRGFFYAGTGSLVVSLWAVNDGSTAHFMQRFYESLRAGNTKAAALRAATLATKCEYPHPYHWAPFVLVGCSE